MQDWRYLAVNTKELIDGHLCDPDRKFHGKDDVLRNFDKLADEARFLAQFGTGGGRSPLARGMNMLVMYGIRQGMQFAVGNVVSKSKLR